MFITAEQARELSNENAYAEVEREKETIMEKIKSFAMEGKYEVVIEGNIRTSTLEWLCELGFAVVTGSKYNESYCRILWR